MMYIVTQLLLAASIVMAQSPTVTDVAAPSGVDSATPTATLSIRLNTVQISSCAPMNITWNVENESAGVSDAILTLFYSTLGVNQMNNSTGILYTPHNVMNSIAQKPVSSGAFLWNPVWLIDPGFYVITATKVDSNPSPRDPPILVQQSTPFLLTVQDTSCMSLAPSSTLTSTPSITNPQTSSSASSSASSETPVAVFTSKSSNVGPIVGGTLAGCAVLGLLMALLICRRRRQVIAKNVTPRTIAGKSHNRTWGGLSSIDKLQGEIPVVMPSESPYAYRRRSQSTGRAMTLTTDEDGEKGHKDVYPVDADLLAEMPTLDQMKSNRRYSSDALSNVLRQNGGFDKHARNMVPAPAVPVLSTTTATSGGGDDPFSDAAFLAHGRRLSALSVPSTARSPSRVSEASTPSPSPVPPATPVASQPSTMARNGSANASVGRPSRKPVPQYEDEFELKKPNKSSPTSLHPPSRSRPSSSRADLSPSVTSHSNTLVGSIESSSTNWMHAPTANRNIGLAGQNEGSAVHYLIPDMPPPPRD